MPGELHALRREAQAVEPAQRVADLFGIEALRAELAAQLLELGARIAAPVVFVDEHEHFEHGANIAHSRVARRPVARARRRVRRIVSRARCAGTGRRAGARRCRRVRARAAAPAARRRCSRCARTARPGSPGRSPASRSSGARSPASALVGRGSRGSGRRHAVEAQFFQDVVAPISTSLAPWRISAWQPRDCGEWIEPGIANTSLPCSAASRAVISEPDCSAASTTSVPRDRPAMMRLRLGKFWLSGGVPSGNSLTIRPACRDAVRQVAVPGRVDAVQPGADHRHRGRAGAGRRRASSAPSCAAPSMPSARPDTTVHAGLAEARGANARAFGSALRRRIAAADHGDAAAELRQVERRRAEQVEHQRRVGHFQQRGRIAGIAQRQDAARARRGFGALQPFQRLVEQRGAVRRAARSSACACASVTTCSQRRRRLREDVGGQAEGRQQLARGGVADAGRQRQPQPAREFFALHAKATSDQSGVDQQVADLRGASLISSTSA